MPSSLYLPPNYGSSFGTYNSSKSSYPSQNSTDTWRIGFKRRRVTRSKGTSGQSRTGVYLAKKKRTRNKGKMSLKKRVAKLEKNNPKSTHSLKRLNGTGIDSGENLVGYQELAAWDVSFLEAFFDSFPGDTIGTLVDRTPTTSDITTKSYKINAYSSAEIRNNSQLSCWVDVYLMVPVKDSSSTILTRMAAADGRANPVNVLDYTDPEFYPSDFVDLTRYWKVKSHQRAYMNPGDQFKKVYTDNFSYNPFEEHVTFVPKAAARWLFRVRGSVGGTATGAGYSAIATVNAVVYTKLSTHYDGDGTGPTYDPGNNLAANLTLNAGLDNEDNEP